MRHFLEKFSFSNQFFANLNHSNLLNGRIDLFLADDLIATNYNCNLFKVPKLNHRLVISGKKRPGNCKFPGQSNREASRLGRR